MNQNKYYVSKTYTNKKNLLLYKIKIFIKYLLKSLLIIYNFLYICIIFDTFCIFTGVYMIIKTKAFTLIHQLHKFIDFWFNNSSTCWFI